MSVRPEIIRFRPSAAVVQIGRYANMAAVRSECFQYRSQGGKSSILATIAIHPLNHEGAAWIAARWECLSINWFGLNW